jgi:RNA polymerase sigma-70 factor (TIGR02960 family)
VAGETDLPAGLGPAAFEELVAPHRAELLRLCYRMTGSVQDAEDALQEALLAAWRGLAAFEGRSSVRTWLHRIATHACLRLTSRRPPRVLVTGPAFEQTADLGRPIEGPVFLEPWVHGPDEAYERREGIELAFVAALQQLPGTQRAVLILREVLQFSAAEVAEVLGTSVPSVNSALQRARATIGSPDRPGPPARADERALVAEFVAAWERADVPALVSLLTADARFVMPPLPAWFDGPQWIERFWRERMFATPWRLRPIRANGQLAFVCHQAPAYEPAAILVLTLRDGRIADLTSFLDPALLRRLPAAPMSSGATPAL